MPDLRNTRVVDLVAEFKSCNCNVDIYDPWVNIEEASHEYGITPIKQPKKKHYEVIVLAVAHNEFIELGVDTI